VPGALWLVVASGIRLGLDEPSPVCFPEMAEREPPLEEAVLASPPGERVAVPAPGARGRRAGPTSGGSAPRWVCVLCWKRLVSLCPAPPCP